MKPKISKSEQDPLSKNAQGNSKIYHEVLLLMKFLQTKPQVKYMNNKYFDLYYTVIETTDENENVINNENDYTNFNNFTTPNHYVGIKPRATKLK